MSRVCRITLTVSPSLCKPDTNRKARAQLAVLAKHETTTRRRTCDSNWSHRFIFDRLVNTVRQYYLHRKSMYTSVEQLASETWTCWTWTCLTWTCWISIGPLLDLDLLDLCWTWTCWISEGPGPVGPMLDMDLLDLDLLDFCWTWTCWTNVGHGPVGPLWDMIQIQPCPPGSEVLLSPLSLLFKRPALCGIYGLTRASPGPEPYVLVSISLHGKRQIRTVHIHMVISEMG
ncbi:hypothetical protein F2P81_012396 [Scophthalmus maximus]|uniref:Uncharacterized protein n=1 Tax=Scophthalmus maximus TaxID=52904 RepID=A0A6A4SR90_SCOMX|nr:hypothetical protein F2P81_012396 [Scophthalmus maximus]